MMIIVLRVTDRLLRAAVCFEAVLQPLLAAVRTQP